MMSPLTFTCLHIADQVSSSWWLPIRTEVGSHKRTTSWATATDYIFEYHDMLVLLIMVLRNVVFSSGNSWFDALQLYSWRLEDLLLWIFTISSACYFQFFFCWGTRFPVVQINSLLPKHLYLIIAKCKKGEKLNCTPNVIWSRRKVMEMWRWVTLLPPVMKTLLRWVTPELTHHILLIQCCPMTL